MQNKVFRPLRVEDYHKNYLELLGELSYVGQMNFEQFQKIFKDLPKIYVLEDLTENIIIASATLLVEQKIIHRGNRAGHIEDVVVSKNYRGGGYGELIVRRVIEEAQKLGLYKVTLHCNDNLVGFYQRCGLIVKGTQMAQYF